MDVFISWSGKRSEAAAEAIRGWLPKVINALRPWLSTSDIDKGSRWGTEVAAKLGNARAGIICLTPDNLHSDWLLFEAGALSKTIENALVCTLLIDLDVADISGPLAQFQATRATKADVSRLLTTLNGSLGENALDAEILKEACDAYWPKLESKLASIPSVRGEKGPRRSEREILEEVLQQVRAIARQQNRIPAVENWSMNADLSQVPAEAVKALVSRDPRMSLKVLDLLYNRETASTPTDSSKSEKEPQ